MRFYKLLLSLFAGIVKNNQIGLVCEPRLFRLQVTTTRHHVCSGRRLCAHVNLGGHDMQSITKHDFGFRWPVWRFMLMGVLALSLLLFRSVQSQPSKSFNQASLKGQYALVGTGGNDTAASIGIEVYEGQGNVTRTLILNEPNAD